MTTKPHILILPRWYPNKTDVQLGSFIQQQAIILQEYYQVHVIYVQANTEQGQTFEIESSKENGIDEQIVYFKSAKGPFKKIINARRFKKAQELAYIIDPYVPTLCHVHVPYRSAFLALKLNKSGIPFVITEHWSGHLTGEFDKKNTPDKKLYRSVLKKAAGIATVSQLLQKKFKENTGFESSVIPNIIKSSKGKQNKKSNSVEIISVSDFSDEIKNISGIINAIKEAKSESPNIHLTIIGGGPDEAKIKNLIRELALEDTISLKGRLALDDVLQAYHDCDFYICNSNFETFGMAVAEAIAAGKPVICSRCGGPEEFVNENNGILIDKNATDQLCSAIIRMSDLHANYDADLISSEIQAKFGAKAVKEKLHEFYKNALNGTSN